MHNEYDSKEEKRTDLSIEGIENKNDDTSKEALPLEKSKLQSSSYLELLKEIRPKTLPYITGNSEMVKLAHEVYVFWQKIIPETPSTETKDQKKYEEKLSWDQLAKYPLLTFNHNIQKHLRYFYPTIGHIYKIIVFIRCVLFLKHIENSLQDENFFQHQTNQDQFATLAKELEKAAHTWLDPLQYRVFAKGVCAVKERIFKQGVQPILLPDLIRNQINFYNQNKGFLRRWEWKSAYQNDMQKLVELKLEGKSEEEILIGLIEIIIKAHLKKIGLQKKLFDF